MSALIDRKYRLPPPAFSGMSIGILGGSFNPPHEGHKSISLSALKRLSLDRLWWAVSPGNPLKSHNRLAPLKERIEKGEVLTNHAKIDVTAFEISRSSPFTFDTLEWLSTRFGGTRFVWIMGADNLMSFHQWRKWKDIFALLPIAVIDRPEYRFKALSSRAAKTFEYCRIEESDSHGLALLEPPAWTFITVPLSSISSTEIRQTMRV